MPNKDRIEDAVACAFKFDYIKEALVTRSDDWYGEKVSREHFLDALANSIGHLKQLDRIKKSVFYGRDFIFNYPPDIETIKTLPGEIYLNPKKAEYLIHAIIGVATEAGELLEALHKMVLFNQPIDAFNILEEQGDSFWYHAILADVCGTTFDKIEKINIEKLRARYPEKFNAHDANNRDLDKERNILESNTEVITKEAVKSFVNSSRGFNWLLFANDVLKHIETYTVPQYGDSPNDQVESYTAEDCIKQANKYIARFGKNSRPGQEKLDLLKAAHYIQLAAEKM